MVNTAATQASIGGGQTMNEDAARYWNALVTRVKLDTGIVIVPTEGTRTYDRQKYLYDNWVARRPGFNPAWAPTSQYAYHLSGRAVDVGSSVGYVLTRESREFYARAGTFGFRPTVQGEPWHFEWRADWVGVPLEDAPTVAKIIPSVEEEHDMTVIVNVGKDYWVADLGAKTKWNATAGGVSIPDAFARLKVYRDMGVRQYDNQSPVVLAGFRDITKG